MWHFGTDSLSDTHIGCLGWSYSAWQGPFYPLNLDNSRWLSYYSRMFDFVEIDSPFYRTINVFMVKKCKERGQKIASKH